MVFAIIVPTIAAESIDVEDALPAGEGRDIVDYACSQCHGLLQVTSAKKTSEQWLHLVKQMKNQGAPIEEDEIEIIVRYLSQHFAK